VAVIGHGWLDKGALGTVVAFKRPDWHCVLTATGIPVWFEEADLQRS
jgi:hypothetical protein